MSIQQTSSLPFDMARQPSVPAVPRQESQSVSLSPTGRQPALPAGKVMPADAEQRQGRAISREDLSASVSRLNDYARNISRDLKFTIDEELNRVIVRVYNAETNEMIRQIPSEEALAMARHLVRDEGIILDTEV